MGIRTKLNPLGGTESKSKYKAYIVIGTNYTDVADLGFTENINPNTCFGSPEDTVDCASIILNGKAYKYSSSTLTRIGNLTNCTSINDSATQGWIISDGKLYYHDSNGTARIGSLSNWTAISGKNDYSYGIAGGKIYQIYSDTATLLSATYTTATAVCSCPSGSGILGVAIIDGSLWFVGAGNTRALYSSSDTIGTDVKASAISGYIRYNSSGLYGAYCIGGANNYAYAFVKSSNSATPTQISTGVRDVTQLSGVLRASYQSGNVTYAYCISQSNVYKLVAASSGSTKITSSNNVTSVCGRYQSGYYTTSNGELYRIGSSISKVNIPATTCLKVYGCGTSSSPALAIFEE